MSMQTEEARPNQAGTIWRPLHAYLMSVVCLCIGVAIGYLVRGSAPPAHADELRVIAERPLD